MRLTATIVGWVNIGNGLLSTPVMQRDNEYYLTHNFYVRGGQSRPGFFWTSATRRISATTTPSCTDTTSPATARCSNVLTNFRDPEFVAENPVIQVNTLYQKYEYAVAAVYLAATRPEHGEIFDYINYLKFSTQDAKEAYIAQIEKRSMLDTGVELTADDKLLTFSTCSYEFADARLGGGGAPPAGRRDGGGLRQGGSPDRGPADAGDLDRVVWIIFYWESGSVLPAAPLVRGFFARGWRPSGASCQTWLLLPDVQALRPAPG